jgi:galactose mutarotase-like enzyme
MGPTKVSRLGRTALDDGRSVERYRLEAGAVSLEVMTLGAAVTFLAVPDHAGRADNVVLAHERLGDCAGRNRDYFGATIGRGAKPRFPSIRLDPGQRYEATTVWRFEIVA